MLVKVGFFTVQYFFVAVGNTALIGSRAAYQFFDNWLFIIRFFSLAARDAVS